MTTGELEAELKSLIASVWSVAFSQDSSQVVYVLMGPDVKATQIWNTVTGKLQTMTTTTITLPDASIVQRVGKEHFHISYPEQTIPNTHGPLSISDDCQWIVGTHHDCWIPSHNRNFISSSISGDRVCLGYPSGNMIILDIKVSHK